jgi:hypothetical protein
MTTPDPQADFEDGIRAKTAGNKWLRAEHSKLLTLSYDHDELEDCLAVENTLAKFSADSWMRGETNVYLKTDEAKRFKQLMVNGIEVKKCPFHGGSIRKSQIRIYTQTKR